MNYIGVVRDRSIREEFYLYENNIFIGIKNI